MAIKDTGVGIPADHLPRIFDRFYRVDPARADGTGAGLDLSICQSIAKTLAGNIAIESVIGQGTEVIVSMPFKTKHRRVNRSRRFSLK